MRSLYFEVNVARILATRMLSRVFPSAPLTAVSPVRFGELPDAPLPGPDWVRVSTSLAGICGSDVALFFVQASPAISLAALPGVPRAFLGHEVVGRVLETGPAVQDLSSGDRVALKIFLPCCSTRGIEPQCAACREGNYTLCENFSEGAVVENTGAGFSDRFLAHRSQLVQVPPEIPDEAAVLIEPVAVSLHAVLRRPPAPGENVLVIGAGTIGLNVVQSAKAVEPAARIFVLEPQSFKQAWALRLGADEAIQGDPYEGIRRATGARLYKGALGNRVLLGGFDLVYDCVGHSDTLHHGLRWLRARGDYVMVGNQLWPATFDQTPLWHQELRLIGVNAHGCESWQGAKVSTFDLAMDFLRAGKIRLDGFITHRFPLDQYRQAFRLARRGGEGVIKIAFDLTSRP